MFSQSFGADVYGTKARVIRIEADVSDGLPVFDMVGFLASAVKEARERVRIAVRQMGIRFPAKRITVNLSPANVRKEGTTFDLPIAICLLTAFGHLSKECIKDTMFIGELGLDGSVQSVNGVLAMVLEGKKQGLRQFLVPKGNVKEAARCGGCRWHKRARGAYRCTARRSLSRGAHAARRRIPPPDGQAAGGGPHGRGCGACGEDRRDGAAQGTPDCHLRRGRALGEPLRQSPQWL